LLQQHEHQNVQHMTTEVAPLKQHPIKGASKRGQVTGKLAHAINLMVEHGTPWNEAAVKAGLTVRSMRLSLKKQHVVSHLWRERQVFLAGVCAANPQRLAAIRENDRNLAASVRAVSELEQMAGNPAARGGFTPGETPGLTIRIISADAPMRVIPPTVDLDAETAG
jgi:hypothetical protein